MIVNRTLRIRIVYFVLSFFLENGIYVDIMSVFKEKNKDERANPQGECPIDIQASEPQADGMLRGSLNLAVICFRS